MQDFPTILTSRLRLGKIEEKYFSEIASLANNRQISDNLISLPYPYDEKDAKTWMEIEQTGFETGLNYIFAIYKKKSDRFIGGIGLHLDKNHNKAELGYWIGERFWNNGYATEAGKEVLKFGFDKLKLNKIFATHFLFNPASEVVLKKIGMRKEATLHAHYFKNEKYRDANQYYILREAFIQNT